MKSNDIDALLSGLLGNQGSTKKQAAPPPAPAPEPPKPPVASENARRRVEEIMRSVELENSRRRESASPAPKPQPLPKREPVVVPPPISHFSEEPSQNPAVRMRDRLDEISLPMIDTERKPTQIIPPKPKEEPKPKKKKKKQTVAVKAKPAAQPQSVDIPAPQTPPKRKIPHINIPDELPPDIPRVLPQEPAPEPVQEPIREAVQEPVPEPTPQPEIVQEAPKEDPAELRRRKIEAAKKAIRLAQEAQDAAPAVPEEEPPTPPEPQPEIADEPVPAQEPAQPEYDEREQEILRKAQNIRDQIRQAMEEIQAVPEPEELQEELPAEEVQEEEIPEAAAETEPAQEEAAEEPPAQESPKKRFGGLFRRRAEAQEAPAEAQPEAPTEEPEQEQEIAAAEVSEVPETAEAPEESEIPSEPEEAPKTPRLRHLSEPVEPQKSGLLGAFSRKKKQNLSEIPEDTDADLLLQEMEDEQESEKIEELLAQTDPPAAAPDEAPPEPPSELTSPEEASIHVSLPGEDEKKRKGSRFSKALRAALDEDVQELADVKAEPLPEESEIDVALGKSRYRRRRTYFVVGILCSVFAVIGIVACVMQGIRWTHDFIDSTSLSHQLEDVLYPVTVVDLPAFDDPAQAAPETLLSAAVIDILMYDDLSKYPEAFDILSIPAQDVRSRAAAMFGIEIAQEPETLIAAGELFFLDESTGCYNVPASPVIFSYAPDVREIRSAGEEQYTVTVDYRSDSAQWQNRSGNFDSAIEKTMEITLQKNGDSYRIIRIVNISEKGI